MKVRPVLTNFSAGELSPKLAGRVDLEVYGKGAQEITNFQVQALGGVSKRPGTKFIYQTYGTNGRAARIIPWVIDDSNIFLIEITGTTTAADCTIRIFCNDALVVSTSLPLTSTNLKYLAAELPEIQYAQAYRELYLVHKNHPPVYLRYVSGTVSAAVFEFDDAVETMIGNLIVWTAPTVYPYETYDFWEKIGMWLIPKKPYTVTGTFNSKTASTITRHDDSVVITYTSGDPDTITRGTNSSLQGTLNIDMRPFLNANNYPSVITFFAGRLWMGGSINDPTTLWGSKANDLLNFCLFEEVAYDAEEKTEANVVMFGTEEGTTAVCTADNAILTGFSGLTVDALIGKYCSGLNIAYASKVTDNDATTVTLSIKALATGTCFVQFTSWRDAKVSEYDTVEQITQQVGPGSAVRLKLRTEEDETIRWIAGRDTLNVGTSSSEWSIDSAHDATRSRAILISRYGSTKIQARMIGNSLVYVSASSRHVRQLGDIIMPPLTAQAEHMVKDGITQIDFQQAPDVCLYAVLTTGDMVRCLIDPTLGVMAWDRIRLKTGDKIISVAVVPASDKDRVYIVTERVVNSVTKRYIELFQENTDLITTSRWYLDLAVEKTGAAFTSVTGITHLASQECSYRCLLATGVWSTGLTTPNGSGEATVPSSTYALIGLGYSSRLKTQRLDSRETEGLKKALGSIFLRLRNCAAFTLGWGALSGQTAAVTIPDADIIYTGGKEVTTDSLNADGVEIIIDSNDPVPCGIQTIVPIIDIEE